MNEHPAAVGTRKSLVASLLISTVLVAPFIVLEWINRSPFHEEFPFVLFTFMSLHALLIARSLTPPLQRLQAERSLKALKLGHWAGLLLGAVLICIYAGVVLDQLPCFLGVPNCD